MTCRAFYRFAPLVAFSGGYQQYFHLIGHAVLLLLLVYSSVNVRVSNDVLHLGRRMEPPAHRHQSRPRHSLNAYGGEKKYSRLRYAPGV